MRRRIILASLMLSLCGCVEIKTEGEVYGSYELTAAEGKVFLEVAADHSYSETIKFFNGREQRNSGAWRWDDGRVCITALLAPRSAVKNYFLGPGDLAHVVGDAYQLDDCIPAERQYGKTILELNPDGPENFVRVKATTARR